MPGRGTEAQPWRSPQPPRQRHELLAGLRRRAVDADPVRHLPAHGLYGGTVLSVAGGFGQNTAFARLTAQISRLSELLPLEKTGKANLEEQVARYEHRCRRPRVNASVSAPPSKPPKTTRRERPMPASLTRSSILRKRRRHGLSRRSKFSIRRSVRCAVRLRRWRRHSERRRRRKKNCNYASPISGSV